MLGSAVLTEIVDRVAIITLNRPQRRNAINGALAAGLDAAVRDAASNNEVRVVILTGAAADGGTGGFCAGGDRDVDAADADLMELAVPTDALTGDLTRHGQHAAIQLHLMAKPTIAMIGGPAVGAGLSLAAACDLRIASHDAVFKAGFTSIGLSGDYGGSFLWTRIVGTATARRLYLLDEKLTADQALDLGLVHQVVPAGELRSRTLEIAGRLARLRPGVLARTKDNLNQAEDDEQRRLYLFANEAENQRGCGGGRKP